MRCVRVSGFLADVIQQIHSLRASGVMSSHAAFAFGEAVRAFRKSIGMLCTTPFAISFFIMLMLAISMNKEKNGRFASVHPMWLAWRAELRTLNWAEMFPYPSVSLQQMRQLLALVQ
jgi:hypothetical protein